MTLTQPLKTRVATYLTGTRAPSFYECATHSAEWVARGLPGCGITAGGRTADHMDAEFWAAPRHFEDRDPSWTPGAFVALKPFPKPTFAQIVAHIDQWREAGEPGPFPVRGAPPSLERALRGDARNVPDKQSSMFDLTTFNRTPNPKESPMPETQTLAQRVASYLVADPGNSARIEAFDRLVDSGWFSLAGRDQATALDGHLRDNPTGACADGLRRFREAVQIPEVKTRGVVRVLLEIDTTRRVGLSGPDNDLGIAREVARAACSVEGVTKVDYIDYEAVQTSEPPTPKVGRDRRSSLINVPKASR